MFHRTDSGGFLVCCYKAIQRLNDVEKNYVAISLMLNDNLTGLIVPLIGLTSSERMQHISINKVSCPLNVEKLSHFGVAVLLNPGEQLKRLQ